METSAESEGTVKIFLPEQTPAELRMLAESPTATGDTLNKIRHELLRRSAQRESADPSLIDPDILTLHSEVEARLEGLRAHSVES